MVEAGKNSFYTIIGIIQGLAFVKLLEVSLSNISIVNFSNGMSINLDLSNWILILHSMIGFLIIIRLYSTMLFAIEDYDNIVLGIYELFLIFFIGALEFYLFDALNNFNPRLFYFRFLIISFFTFIGYFVALIKILKNPTIKNYKTERNLQIYNNIGGVYILIILQVIVFSTAISSPALVVISVFCILIIFTNTLFSYYYSLKS